MTSDGDVEVASSDVEHDPDEKLEPEGAGRAESVAMDDELKSEILGTDDDDGESDDADEKDSDEGEERSAAEQVKSQAESEEERERLESFEDGLIEQVEEEAGEADDVEGDVDGGGEAVEVDMNILLDDEIIGSLVAAPFEMADGMIGEPGGEPEMALTDGERDRLAMMIEAVAEDEGWEMTPKTGLILTFLQIVAVRMNRYRQYEPPESDDEAVEDGDGDRDLDELRGDTEQGERVEEGDDADDADSDDEGGSDE